MQPPVKSPEPSIAGVRSSVLGTSLALRGELAGQEDLVIQGKFEGTISIAGQCLTIGPDGVVKADVQAARVVIEGSVTGNISARDRIEVRRTGRVMGDLAAPGIGIEEGAYVKGSIEILREEAPTALVSAETLARRVSTEADDAAEGA